MSSSLPTSGEERKDKLEDIHETVKYWGFLIFLKVMVYGTILILKP